MSTATLATKTLLASLNVGDTFTFRAKRYIVTKVNSVNAQIKEVEGTGTFNLNRSAPVTDVAHASSDDLTKLHAASLPTLEPGTVVRIKGGRFGGMVGIIGKPNQTRYLVAVPHQNSILVGFDSVEVATNDEFVAYLKK